MWTRIPADKKYHSSQTPKTKSDGRVAPDAVLIAGVIADGAYDFLTAVKTPLEYLTSLNLTARARACMGTF